MKDLLKQPHKLQKPHWNHVLKYKDALMLLKTSTINKSNVLKDFRVLVLLTDAHQLQSLQKWRKILTN